VDGRPGGRDAIALAKQLMHPDARITLVHLDGVHVMLGGIAGLVLATEHEGSEKLLARERASTATEAELLAWTAPSVGRGLHELAERQRADLLVIGSCHRGLLGRVFLGDDTCAALNGAPCAVAIAPSGYAEMPRELGKIGVGYKAPGEGQQALVAARSLAARHGSTIRALSVVSLRSIPYGEPIPVGWPQIAKRLVDKELTRFYDLDDVDGDATYGEPGEELARFGDDVDLLIVGSARYGPVGRLFNSSTSNYLARHSRCPLLVLPRTAEGGDDAGATWESTATQPDEHEATAAHA